MKFAPPTLHILCWWGNIFGKFNKYSKMLLKRKEKVHFFGVNSMHKMDGRALKVS